MLTPPPPPNAQLSLSAQQQVLFTQLLSDGSVLTKGHGAAGTHKGACFLIPPPRSCQSRATSQLFQRERAQFKNPPPIANPLQGLNNHEAALRGCTEKTQGPHILSGVAAEDRQQLSLKRQLLNHCHNLSDVDALWRGPFRVWDVPPNLKYSRSLTSVVLSAFRVIVRWGHAVFPSAPCE